MRLRDATATPARGGLCVPAIHLVSAYGVAHGLERLGRVSTKLHIQAACDAPYASLHGLVPSRGLQSGSAADNVITRRG